MKIIKTRTFGIPVEKECPSTLEEMMNLGISEEQAIELAVSYVMEKSVLVQTRKLVLERLAEDTGIERKTRVVGKNKDGTDRVAYDETETKYFDRVCAEQGVERSHYQDLVTEVFNSVELDPTAKERSSKPKKIPATHLELAQEFIDEGKGEALAAFLSKKLGSTVEASLESLALGLQEKDRREKQEKKDRIQAAMLEDE